YRDAGGTGDEMARGLVTGLRPHLAPGGIAQMLLNWEIRDLQDPFARVLQWCRDSGLDAWIIGRDVSDPCEYAETWLRDGGITPERDRKAWERGYHAWVADFDRRGVLAVGFGYLILHRPQRADQEQWLRAEQITTRPPGALGGAIAATLAAKDALAHVDEAALADCALAVAGAGGAAPAPPRRAGTGAACRADHHPPAGRPGRCDRGDPGSQGCPRPPGRGRPGRLRPDRGRRCHRGTALPARQHRSGGDPVAPGRRV